MSKACGRGIGQAAALAGVLVVLAACGSVGAGDLPRVQQPQVGSGDNAGQNSPVQLSSPVAKGKLGNAVPVPPFEGASCPPDLPVPHADGLPGVGATVSVTCGENLAEVLLAIPGAVNAVMPSRIDLLVSFAPAGSPATAGWTQLPSPIAVDGVNISTFSLASGVPARLTAPKTASGMVRVEWVANRKYFQLTSDRGYVAQGLTGVPPETLVQVANTVR